MDAPSLTAAVRRELLEHPEVTEAAHRFGGIVFHLGPRELGHLHGERVADLPLPPHLRDELVASGRLSPDDVASDSDWVSRRVERPEDVAEIVELFRMSYEHAVHAGPVADDEESHEGAPEAGSPRRLPLREVLALPWRPILRRRR